MARPFSREHEHYVLKNRMMASADEMASRERKAAQTGTTAAPPRERAKSCFNCKNKRTCTQFRAKRSGGATGVVSFGGYDDTMICSRYEPAPMENRSMSQKNINSLMRGFMRST